jgi:hypothetical protein
MWAVQLNWAMDCTDWISGSPAKWCKKDPLYTQTQPARAFAPPVAGPSDHLLKLALPARFSDPEVGPADEMGQKSAAPEMFDKNRAYAIQIQSGS